MPYVSMSEVWTPLKWFGIRFFKCHEGGYYIKVKNNPRRKLGRHLEHTDQVYQDNSLNQ